jgi:hypothetical protein
VSLAFFGHSLCDVALKLKSFGRVLDAAKTFFRIVIGRGRFDFRYHGRLVTLHVSCAHYCSPASAGSCATHGPLKRPYEIWEKGWKMLVPAFIEHAVGLGYRGLIAVWGNDSETVT